jgi:hypothetical protein
MRKEIITWSVMTVVQSSVDLMSMLQNFFTATDDAASKLECLSTAIFFTIKLARKVRSSRYFPTLRPSSKILAYLVKKKLRANALAYFATTSATKKFFISLSPCPIDADEFVVDDTTTEVNLKSLFQNLFLIRLYDKIS